MTTTPPSPALFLLFNHTLTALQEADAHAALGVGRIVPAPAAIQEAWSNLPPDLPEISGYLGPIFAWLAEVATPGDFLLVQGDFGATCLVAEFARQKGLLPVYSTTVREADEVHLPDGSVRTVHRFKHRIFRRYGA